MTWRRAEEQASNGIAVASAGAVCLAFLIGLATWPPGSYLQFFEFGHWLGPASDMLHGKVPYRDTFPIHGFLTDGGLDFFLFRLFGPNFANSVWLHQALGTLFQPAIYLVAAAATRRPVICLALTPFTMALSPGLVFDRAVVPLIGLAAFTFAISRTATRTAAFTAGALGVLGVFYALEFGTFVFGAELACLCLLWFMTRSTSPLLAVRSYALGVAAVAIPSIIGLASIGALSAFVRTSFVDLPLHINAVWGLGFPGPFKLVGSWLGLAPLNEIPGVGPIGIRMGARLYLIPMAGVVAAVAGYSAIRRGERETVARLFVVTVACLFCFRYLLARFHYEAGNALVGPTAIAAGFLFIPGRARPRAAVVAAALLVALTWVFGGFRVTRDLIVSAGTARSRLQRCPGCVVFTDARGGGIRVPKVEIDELREIRSLVVVNAAPGPLFDLSNRPGLYFFLDRVNPTRFYQVPMMEFFQDEVLADLKRNPPTCVLFARGSADVAPDGRPNKSRIPKVWDYVITHFPRTISVGDTLLALPPAEPKN